MPVLRPGPGVSTQLLPAPAGTDPGSRRTAVGADDQCHWIDDRNVRCTSIATDTVAGELYCSPHADLIAGI